MSSCYANDKFIVVGNYVSRGRGIYSLDAINWTIIEDIKIVPLSVCYGNGKFIAVGNNGKASYCINNPA